MKRMSASLPPGPAEPSPAPDAPAPTASAAEPARLYWRWLRSSAITPKAFAARLGLDWAALRRPSEGWMSRRARLLAGKERALSGNRITVRLDGLWWELLERLGTCLDAELADEGELKRLVQAAGVLKAAQTGLAGTGASELASRDDGPRAIEGFDVERL